MGAWASTLAPIVNPPARVAGLDAHTSQAGASLLGQFRSSSAAWMYLRTDLYLHNGVEMRPLSELEQKAGRQADEAAEDGHEKLHKENVVTIVPSKERDFRGIFGDIERATAAYKGMQGHTHNDPKKALPLFRLMTWVDPQFVTGWSVGASVLTRDTSERGTREALRFLGEGLRHNPESVELLVSTGQVYATRGKRLKEAVPYFDQARIAGRKNLKMLSEGELDALEQAYRWLSLCLRDLGQAELSRAVAGEGLGLFPNDGILKRLVDTAPSVLSQKSLDRWKETTKAHTHGPECDHDHEEHDHKGHDHE